MSIFSSRHSLSVLIGVRLLPDRNWPPPRDIHRAIFAFHGGSEHVALLDVTRTANLVWQVGELHRDIELRAVERCAELVNHRDVLFDQLAFFLYG